MNLLDYNQFIQNKRVTVTPSGFSIDRQDINPNPNLFENCRCGSKDIKIEGVKASGPDTEIANGWGECKTCGAQGPSGTTEKEAIDKWNDRNYPF